MPLPLPIMIPFMMWQSAAIAAGFGTYFQFAKRRVSAMSNEDFNKADPHELVNSMYDDIVKQIPSSFAKVDSLTPVMLQSMNVMLDQAVKWLQGAITGNFFGTPNPVNEPIDNIGEPTPELTIQLLDPSFQTVKDWASTKLNLAHSQLNKYTSKAQGFIHSVHDFNKGQKVDKFEDVQETYASRDEAFKAWRASINTSTYPDLLTVHYQNIQAAFNFKKFLLYLQPVLVQSKAKWLATKEGSHLKNIRHKQYLAIIQIFQDVNKFLEKVHPQ